MQSNAAFLPNPAQHRLPGVALRFAQRTATRPPPSGVPLFVGFAAEPAAAPFAVDRWERYAQAMSKPAPGHLDHAVRGFFENGGAVCWIAQLPLPQAAGATVLRDRLLAAFRRAGPLEDLDQPDLVCVPDATWGPLGQDAAAVRAVQGAVLAYCNRLNDRFALLDCLPRMAGRQSASQRTEGMAATAAEVANGALYWPWLAVPPLAAAPGSATVPPCGHVAGVLARLDAATGRHKAPANERLQGVLDLDDAEGEGEADEAALAALHQDGVNCLRVLPGRGVRICGARTLSNRPAWRHIGARRVVLGLARWAQLGMRDLVMEPHRPALWERIRQRVESHCLARWREGALHGDTPDQAFYVQCDAETNPAASRELGRVVCVVGLAVSMPAEFIEVQLVQSVDGALLRG
ncbi:phage tail sheath family protein [Pseudorhodoferax sp.]|uniref:phage tail sheath family protein n=1 Tax=Pseudorhodoferax sp. TaxID=1993553 RepID=UPI002DD69645|nr:phage tail sheath subtilisin-like domain-containing protein [Pseudorhodoferax sp.]